MANNTLSINEKAKGSQSATPVPASLEVGPALNVSSDAASSPEESVSIKLVKDLIKAGYNPINNPIMTDIRDERGRILPRLFIGIQMLEGTTKNGFKFKVPLKLVFKY